MPQNCCVPGCTKKVYEEDDVKISYHKFPEDKELFVKLIVAIWRDIEKEFRVTEHTRVCSRHFKSRDYVTSLAGRKRTLKTTATVKRNPDAVQSSAWSNPSNELKNVKFDSVKES